ncbi:AbgT family transporter, partial [Arthrospira platensis SPKY1]|nr:AbgT family transporter [Arthrospira platensis SPKY1]
MQQQANGWVNRFLSVVERLGNALPHPATLFAAFAALIVLLSGVLSLFDLSVVHPGTGQTITIVNLVSAPGLHLILEKMIVNFTGFAPLGTVL